MATPGGVEAFGGRPEQNPKKFLRDLQYQMALSGIATARAKVDFLLLRLEVDSPAEEWYLALDPAIREDWDQLEPQFTAQWNQQQPLARTDAEKTEELLNHKLEPEQVGTTVMYLGRMQHAHIAWADGILLKAQVCGLENRMEYTHQVLAELPGSVRGSMGKNYTNWTTFVQNVGGACAAARVEVSRQEPLLHHYVSGLTTYSLA
jgi:hypothetical protein